MTGRYLHDLRWHRAGGSIREQALCIEKRLGFSRDSTDVKDPNVSDGEEHNISDDEFESVAKAANFPYWPSPEAAKSWLESKLLEETLFVTESGEVGLAPFDSVRKGDWVVIAAESPWPLVVREVETRADARYQSVCPASIAKWMVDERRWPENEVVEGRKWIHLV